MLGYSGALRLYRLKCGSSPGLTKEDAQNAPASCRNVKKSYMKAKCEKPETPEQPKPKPKPKKRAKAKKNNKLG